MRKHENVLVFSEGTTVHKSQSARRMPYNPQGLIKLDEPVTLIRSENQKTDVFFQTRKSHGEHTREYTNYPDTILEFATEQKKHHPTAKPVNLMEYLIKTYTDPGAVVLDNAMGGGATGVACINTDRLFVGMELDNHYFNMSKERLEKTLTP